MNCKRTVAYDNESLALYKSSKNRSGEALAANNIGNDYAALGQLDKAMGYYQRALRTSRELRQKGLEAILLGNIGSLYIYQGRRVEAAQEAFKKALQLHHQLKTPIMEALTLGKIGGTFALQGRTSEASKYCDRAMAMGLATKNRPLEATLRTEIGRVYFFLGKKDKAREYGNAALPIIREVNNRGEEVNTLLLLMSSLNKSQRPLAIFYGKQALNIMQSVRTNIRGLERESRHAFVVQVQSSYHALADLLIADSRLPEAQEVLNLLKQEEYSEFLRGGDKAAPEAGTVEFTPRELEWQALYNKVADRVTETGLVYADLLKKRPRSSAEQAKLATLRLDLEASNRAFHAYLDTIEKEFASGKLQNRLGNVHDVVAISRALGKLEHHSVAVYTLVGEKALRFLVITPQAQVAREYAIGAEALNKKVAAFRSVLEDPGRDPRPQGKALYDILIKPIEGDLAGARAGTVMWSLDGALRYLPFAALWDGKQYLLEKWCSTLFTAASMDRLVESPDLHWTALGLGVSKAHIGFSPLPGAAAELRSIVRTTEPGSAGLIPGVILLDDQFTQKNMESHLGGDTRLVHIAGHFSLRPGNMQESYLLLGDGSHLTLDAIQAMPTSLFQGINLLTLSCCDTAMSQGAGAGSEVESFGTLAQQEGADAVLATLWSVADKSTEALMQKFYTIRQSHPELTKIEVLRQAQTAMLRGVVGGDSKDPVRGAMIVNPPATGRYVPDPKSPYSHPYYWAPFILIGNWK